MRKDATVVEATDQGVVPEEARLRLRVAAELALQHDNAELLRNLRLLVQCDRRGDCEMVESNKKRLAST